MATRVLMCQLVAKQRYNTQKSWIELDEVRPQFEKCWEIIRREKVGLAIFPETSYLPELYDTYRELSENCLIIAGSLYNEDSINETHVFGPNGYYKVLPKLFPSPKEVMELHHPNQRIPDQIIKGWEADVQKGHWPDYFPLLGDGSDKRIAILNCMDYYRLGYYVANSSILSPHIWALISPCSNGQQEIFTRLSGAIHDANERVYSMVVNSNNASRPAGASQGLSYIMGPVTFNVRRLLAAIGQENDHFSYIYQLGEGAEALSMDLMDGADVRFFARSKDFFSNPANISRVDLL